MKPEKLAFQIRHDFCKGMIPAYVRPRKASFAKIIPSNTIRKINWIYFSNGKICRGKSDTVNICSSEHMITTIFEEEVRGALFLG